MHAQILILVLVVLLPLIMGFWRWARTNPFSFLIACLAVILLCLDHDRRKRQRWY